MEQILNFLYSEEQNVTISSFWDAGWTLRLGDASNGFTFVRNVECLDHGVRHLLEAYFERNPEARTRFLAFQEANP